MQKNNVHSTDLGQIIAYLIVLAASISTQVISDSAERLRHPGLDAMFARSFNYLDIASLWPMTGVCRLSLVKVGPSKGSFANDRWFLLSIVPRADPTASTLLGVRCSTSIQFYRIGWANTIIGLDHFRPIKMRNLVWIIWQIRSTCVHVNLSHWCEYPSATLMSPTRGRN